MIRLTKAIPGGEYRVPEDAVQSTPGGYSGPAVEKLARFENMADDLAARQEAIAQDLEALRAAGRQNTVQFKQLLAEKLTNAGTLALLETYCG